MGMNDPDLVAKQCADERGLVARRRVWDEFRDGPSSDDRTFDAVGEAAPRHLLEVGCGWGAMAERLVRDTGADVVACDLSPRMVELARRRGVHALVGSAEALPFPDASFDVVLANAMLYHVPDLHRGLTELARVLTDDGTLISTTFGRGHLREVWELVGEPEVDLTFRVENAQEILHGFFDEVEMQHDDATVTFPNADEVRTYVASSVTRSEFADLVPTFEGPFVAHSDFAVCVARRPRRREPNDGRQSY
jgi:SAM-dependent methyltransferase